MAEESLVSPSLLRKLLAYDPATGKLTWLARPPEMFPSFRGYISWSAAYVGKEAFTSIDNGYRQGTVMKHKMRAHRVAWAIYYGRWPEHQVDHLNGNRSDNRIENLRDVPNVINARNMRPRTALLLSGVAPAANGKRWQAKITIDYKTHHLGTFDTVEEAIAARRLAELKAGFRPTSSNRIS